MKNKQIVLLFLLLTMFLISSNIVFAENSTDITDNNIITSENNNQESYVNENQIETVSDKSDDVNSDENIVFDINNNVDNSQLEVNGHTKININPDNFYYIEISDFRDYYGDKYLIGNFDNGNFSFNMNYGVFDVNTFNMLKFYSDDEYLGTLTFSFDYDTLEVIEESINFNKTRYIKEDNSYILVDGNYFDKLLEEISSSSSDENIQIDIKDNVYLDKAFSWNNQNINLTINGHKLTDLVENHYVKEYPFYTFSTPAIQINEKCNLTFNMISLVNKDNTSGYILNDGILNLNDIFYKCSNNISDESFLIINNNYLKIKDNLHTVNYSSEEEKRNLIYNKDSLIIEPYWSDIDSTEYEESDYPNYLIYNEGQVKNIVNTLKNTKIESNSEYEYDVIFEQGYSSDYQDSRFSEIKSNNLLLNRTIIESDDIINAKNITIESSEILGASINADNLKIINSTITSNRFDINKDYYTDYNEYISNFNREDPYILNLNVTNLTAINNTFNNPVFKNNILKADNIRLESNTFKFDENFEKVTTAKMNDYNKVELIYDNLIYKDNALNSFEFITVDTTSESSNNNDGTTTKNYKQNKKSFKNKHILKNKSYKNVKTFNQKNSIILHQNDEITLAWLNDIFDYDLSNKEILIYIGDILVFNGSTSLDLSEVLFNITSDYNGSYTLKVITDNSTLIKEIIIN